MELRGRRRLFPVSAEDFPQSAHGVRVEDCLGVAEQGASLLELIASGLLKRRIRTMRTEGFEQRQYTLRRGALAGRGWLRWADGFSPGPYAVSEITIIIGDETFFPLFSGSSFCLLLTGLASLKG